MVAGRGSGSWVLAAEDVAMRRAWLLLGLPIALLAAAAAVLGAVPKPAGWVVVVVAALAGLAMWGGKLLESAGIEGAKAAITRRSNRDRLQRVGVATDARGRLPRVDQANPLRLGVHRAAVVVGASTAGELPPYVRRDFDDELDAALRRGGLVLLEGPSAAGKTRAAFEAIQRVCSSRRLLVPRDPAGLAEALAAQLPLRSVVVWLDDLERYLQPSGLDGPLADKLCAAGAMIVATLRAEERANLDLADQRAADTPGKAIIRAATEVLQRAQRIQVARALSAAEQARAQRHRSDPRIADALDHAGEAGLVEYIAAGPAAVDRLTAGRNGAHPTGAALVDAAIDCRRAGYYRPLPPSLLEQLYLPYLPTQIQYRTDLPTLDQALAWAIQPVRGATCLLTPAPDNAYVVFDYLIDHAQAQPSTPIPDHIWTGLISSSCANHTDLFAIGSAAYLSNRPADAHHAWRRAATEHNPDAMYNMGVLLKERGELDQAQDWYYRAATDHNHPGAMNNLGRLLDERGERDQAQAWYYRAATKHNHANAMINLGILFKERGELDQAQAWWRRAAADHNDPDAMYSLGVLLKERGELDQAQAWYHRAATDHNHPGAMYNLGGLLYERGELDQAQAWYHRAATDHNHPEAMNSLGVLLQQRGDLDQAQAWYHRAATEHSHPEAMVNLGFLLQQRGELDQAQPWWRRAATEHNHPHAMTNLGLMFKELGELDQAQAWYHQAATDHDHPDAMLKLGILLHERGELDQAQAWYHQAAIEHDNPDAMSNLGVVLHERGELDQAQAWYHRAATEHHNPDAMHNLGSLLKERGELDQAQAWWHRAATEHNHPDAMHKLGVLLHERGELDQAQAWISRAATEHNCPDAIYSLGVLLQHLGELDQAQAWYHRAATEHNRPDAMHNLGVLLKERGELDQAQAWYHRAATEHHHLGAMINLGTLFHERGELDQAQAWYHRAATEHNHPIAMHNLGVILRERSKHTETQI